MSKKSKTGRKADRRPSLTIRHLPVVTSPAEVWLRGPLGAVGSLLTACPHRGITLSDAALNHAGAAVTDRLLPAVRSGNAEALTLALEIEHLNAIDVRSYSGMGPVYNVNALHLSAHFGHAHLLPILLDAGYDVNTRDSDGATPLHWGVRTNQLGVVLTLLAAGADLEATDHDGYTPLGYAAADDRLALVHALLAAGANPDVVDRSRGHTPLSIAEAMKHHEVAAVLRHITTIDAPANGANAPVCVPIDSGYTALHNAVAMGDADEMHSFMEQGADMLALTKRGMGLLEVALVHGQTPTAWMLIRSSYVQTLINQGKTQAKAVACLPPLDARMGEVLAHIRGRMVASGFLPPEMATCH
ncbi:Ankyrin repeat [Paraburkholderia phenazinium]|uniref:Ankyrin repeat n=1 Tax=Paraburkholderia phenazinium TaxID=60549 RepID=A0A1G7YEL2_9BURK|nr:ankyrin repeat domain-containing protein [Paraburkholderia phenazinium]SDG94998.1 Ankyrin repeat [Paraburkholderia phenazinium]